MSLKNEIELAVSEYINICDKLDENWLKEYFYFSESSFYPSMSNIYRNKFSNQQLRFLIIEEFIKTIFRKKFYEKILD